MAVESTEQARAKLLQVYRFLQALNDLRNPVQRRTDDQLWLLWFRDLPDHPTIRRGRYIHAAPESDGEPEGDPFILKVARPTLQDAPEPPASVQEWLLPGWRGIEGEIRVHEDLKVVGADGLPSPVRFGEDPHRVQLLAEWSAVRESWRTAERPARIAMNVFERLWALQTQVENEAERVELVLGDGILRWSHGDAAIINHPVLLQRLELRFDPAVPEFTIAGTEHPPELYTALFRAVPQISATAVGRCREDLDLGGWHPLGDSETSEFLRRLVSQLSPRGEFTGEREPDSDAQEPHIGRSPVIFLRRRGLGFATAIEAILGDLPTAKELPPSVTRIVGVESPDQSGGAETDPQAWNGESEDVLLTKGANKEQLLIAQRLEKHGAVLVQGPPGTGKTHTIGNLLGHLLAQGKSVLVTSHTAKALKILHEQVVEPLQPLCVSVLSDSTRQMERAVDGITERLSSSNETELERQAAAVVMERNRLLARLRAERLALQNARCDEYRPVVVAGEEYHPSEAARRVAATGDADGWVPSPVTAEAPLPVTVGDLADLYRTNSTVTPADERELAWTLPEGRDLMPPAEFARLLDERGELERENLEFGRDLWGTVPKDQTPEALQNLGHDLLRAGEILGQHEGWRLAAVAAGRQGGDIRAPWDDLIREIESVYAAAAAAQLLLLKFGPELPDDCLPDRVERVLSNMGRHVQAGGRIGPLQVLTRPDWKRVMERARVGSRPPVSPEDFGALLALVRLRTARSRLAERWERQMGALGAPKITELGPEPEQVCHQFIPPLAQCLQWHQRTWAGLERALVTQGLSWEAFLATVPPCLGAHPDLLRLRHAVLHALPPVLAAQARRARWNEIDGEIRSMTAKLSTFGTALDGPDVVLRLRESVRALDTEEYRCAFERLMDLRARGADLLRRRTLLAALEGVAPGWAAAIRHRRGEHGGSEPPGDARRAWIWRQLEDELERRAAVSMDEIQARIAQLGLDLQRTTTDLVDCRAWAAQVRRTTLVQRQALQGWKAIMGRVGKGTGVRVPRYFAEARKLMPVCQTAVPVWIMPLSQVVDNFDPSRNRFDVVIIDEASQADVMALVALYLGRQVVVVGDDQQVSPDAVGQKWDEVRQLIEEHLRGIPNAVLYDGQTSVYDLAQQSFSGAVCLREHFRCVSPIIQFSNHLSYDGKIQPLRDASGVRRRPHTVAYRVEHASSDGKINPGEAGAVASLLMAASERPEYVDATFGVVSLLGNEQALLVDQLLHRFMSPAIYARHQVQCGNSAQFQGDQRDVMFVSLVAAGGGTGPMRLQAEGARDSFKKRINVAASRARDQMWVVHSMDPETDLQADDLRRRLIAHAKDPEAVVRLLETKEGTTESEFERQVLRRLLQAGYRVTPQWRVGAYRIDLVVEGAGQRLAVECDGERWHPLEKVADDMARQAILERVGWRFVRIRGSQFFRDPDEALRPVFERLETFGILAEHAAGDGGRSDPDGQTLKEWIVRRAAELRRQWQAVDDEDPTAPSAPKPFGRRDGRREPVDGLLDATETQPAGGQASVAPPSAVGVLQASDKEKPKQQALPGLAADRPFDPVVFFVSQGVRFMDKRAQGGRFWVIGGMELAPTMADLRRRGVCFVFAEAGGKATGRRSAWHQSP